MILILAKRATEEGINKVAEDFRGYVKFVVDIKQGILAAGGKMHVDAEQKLIREAGSGQADLWGGGLDLETGEIDFDSMINIRPSQGNSSREVLSLQVRGKIEEIVRKILR